ncbi:MAG: hypothetical protein ACOCQD_02750 [archaeon]
MKNVLKFMLVFSFLAIGFNTLAQEEESVIELEQGDIFAVESFIEEEGDYEIEVEWEWPVEYLEEVGEDEVNDERLILRAISPTPEDQPINMEVTDYNVTLNGRDVTIEDINNPDLLDISPEPRVLHIRIDATVEITEQTEEQ